MPFTDADGNPITCHTCPFKINTDCTAMPPTPSTNALTMQVWNYPPARNPCLRHPALGGIKLQQGVAAVLDESAKAYFLPENVAKESADLFIGADLEMPATEPEPTAEEPANAVDTEVDPGIAGTPTQQRSRRAGRATARPAE